MAGAMTGLGRAESDIYDISKLNIRDGAIHYRLYQQDGSMVAMTTRDTPSNRLFVSWIQIHDRLAPEGTAA